jgi:4-amino-4-deoxy-L-arabinose transferase-like glycosyltransferase
MESAVHRSHMGSKSKIFLWLLTLILIAGGGIYLIKETTRYGASLHADSYYYLSGAEQLARSGEYGRITGTGEFRPITHYPPMFSITVALVNKLGFDVYPAARIVIGGLFGLTILAAGIGIMVATKSIIVSIFAALFTMISPVLIDMYSWAHSEPLYIFLSTLFLVLFAISLTNSKPRGLLVLSALIAGAGILTRYIGLSILIAGMIGLLAFKTDRDLKRRLKDTILFLVISIVPVGIFLLRNYILTGNTTNRPAPFWHPPAFEEWLRGAHTLLEWLLPDELLTRMSSSVEIIVLVTTILAFPLQRIFEGNMLQGFIILTIIYLFIYSCFVLITVLFFDIMTLLDQRILSPIYLPGFLLLLLILSLWWEKPGKLSKILAGCICLGLCSSQVLRTIDLVGELRQEPRGYASGIYRNSPTVEYVRQLPDVLIYTNDIPALYFWGGRTANYIPSRINPSTQTFDSLEDYQQSLHNMRYRMSHDNALLVILGPDPVARLKQNHLEELTEGLVLTAQFDDGLIYKYRAEE